MKCDHSVRSHEWQRCEKCGKIVRVNQRMQIVSWILLLIVAFDITPKLADAAIRMLHLEAYNPYNITHALLGMIPIGFACYFIGRFFPLFDEKEENEQ